ncbi:MAG: TM2 domain-containing protein [Propionibacteriaceae bacterium]|nr:TM2 domain-containing protein [Propionibacteriaceae bacterium]
MSNDPYDDPYASPEEQGARAQDASVEPDRLADVDAPTDAGPAPAPAPTPEPAPAPSESSLPNFSPPAEVAGYAEPPSRGPEPVSPQYGDYANSAGYQPQAYGAAPNPMPQAYDGQPGYGQGMQPGYGYTTQPGYYGGYGNNTPSTKTKMAAGLLGIFLGGLGVHNFYLGYTGKGIAQLLITVLSLGMLAFVSSIWGLIEGIMILTASPHSSAARDAQGNILQ